MVERRRDLGGERQARHLRGDVRRPKVRAGLMAERASAPVPELLSGAVRRLGTVAASAAAALATWAVLARVLTKGLPPGIVVLGLVYGSLYALVAVGIVLIYRADRIV